MSRPWSVCFPNLCFRQARRYNSASPAAGQPHAEADIQAPLQGRKLNNLARAAPGERKPGAAVAVVMNDGAAIVEAISFEAYA